jgi:hypothetical protein
MNDFSQLKREIISTFKQFDPEKIILFGSLARGQEDEESDVDLIVVYQTSKRFMDRLRDLYLVWNLRTLSSNWRDLNDCKKNDSASKRFGQIRAHDGRDPDEGGFADLIEREEACYSD